MGLTLRLRLARVARMHKLLSLLPALLPLAACVAAADATALLSLPEPYALWPDDKGVPINAHGGGILHHGGRYYWYGEHKVAGDAGNYAEVGVHCYSSANLRDWKAEMQATGRK